MKRLYSLERPYPTYGYDELVGAVIAADSVGEALSIFKERAVEFNMDTKELLEKYGCIPTEVSFICTCDLTDSRIISDYWY